MQIGGIDHVNIVTDRLEETADFYARVLGFTRAEAPGATFGVKGAWMHDATGHALVHIVWLDPDRAYGKGHVPGAITGAIQHIAFSCEGFAATIARLQDLGVEHQVNDAPAYNLKQIVLTDPNNINLELNFSLD